MVWRFFNVLHHKARATPVALPRVFQAGFSDWNEVWGRALDAAGCRA
jgi:hypothetical protein